MSYQSFSKSISANCVWYGFHGLALGAALELLDRRLLFELLWRLVLRFGLRSGFRSVSHKSSDVEESFGNEHDVLQVDGPPKDHLHHHADHREQVDHHQV